MFGVSAAILLSNPPCLLVIITFILFVRVSCIRSERAVSYNNDFSLNLIDGIQYKFVNSCTVQFRISCNRLMSINSRKAKNLYYLPTYQEWWKKKHTQVSYTQLLLMKPTRIISSFYRSLWFYKDFTLDDRNFFRIVRAVKRKAFKSHTAEMCALLWSNLFFTIMTKESDRIYLLIHTMTITECNYVIQAQYFHTLDGAERYNNARLVGRRFSWRVHPTFRANRQKANLQMLYASNALKTAFKRKSYRIRHHVRTVPM